MLTSVPMQSMFPSETARPIMQYVRELESKVRLLRAERRQFQVKAFAFGLALGAVAMLVVLRYFH